jgi:hypothetical protein
MEKTLTRNELYTLVKRYNLNAYFMDKLGKSFTQCKNRELEKGIMDYLDENPKEVIRAITRKFIRNNTLYKSELPELKLL